MKTVRVKAINIKKGDVLNGRRIRGIFTFPRRNKPNGVMIVTPNPSGYKLDTLQFSSTEMVTLKRPKKNMG